MCFPFYNPLFPFCFKVFQAVDHVPGIKSTKIPSRTRPINKIAAPAIKENVTAISGPVTVEPSAVVPRIIVWPSNKDMTANSSGTEEKRKLHLS